MTPVSEDPDNNGLVMKLLGCLVTAVGAMMALLFGLCTVYAGAMFAGPGHLRDPTALAIPLIIGGLPTLSGVAIFAVGVWMVVRAGKGNTPK